MTTILPCPFCGFIDVEICEVEPGRIAIDCPECECIGPFADSVDEAAELWNIPTEKLRQVQRHDSIMTEQVLQLETRAANSELRGGPAVSSPERPA